MNKIRLSTLSWKSPSLLFFGVGLAASLSWIAGASWTPRANGVRAYVCKLAEGMDSFRVLDRPGFTAPYVKKTSANEAQAFTSLETYGDGSGYWLDPIFNERNQAAFLQFGKTGGAPSVQVYFVNPGTFARTLEFTSKCEADAGLCDAEIRKNNGVCGSERRAAVMASELGDQDDSQGADNLLEACLVSEIAACAHAR